MGKVGKCGKGSAGATNKDYERALGASVETLRHLQRLKVWSSFLPQGSAPLVELPLSSCGRWKGIYGKRSRSKCISLASSIFTAYRESLERSFEGAKVFYMTVDGFAQAASGLSLSSAYVANFEYVLVNVDEAHQLTYDQLAPIAARSLKLNVCLDQGQHIDYVRHSNEMGVGAELDPSTYYAWGTRSLWRL